MGSSNKLALTFLLLVLARAPILLAAEPPNKEFRVGLILSMTGHAAEYGEAMNSAILLARREHSDKFSRIRFFLEDSRNEARTAVSAFQKLENADKVHLVYVWGVAPCAAIHPIAEARKVPTVLQCYDRESSAGKRYIVRFMNDAESYMTKLAEELRRRGKKHTGVVLGETPYLEEMYDGFKHALIAPQEHVLLGRYHANESDFRMSVSRARTADFDSIAVFLAVGQVAQFLRQAREQRILAPFYGTVSFENRREIEASLGGMEGAMFVGNAVKPDFAERFRKHFGAESQLSFAAMAYEFTVLVGELFGEADPLTKEEIITRFVDVPPRDGRAVKRYRFVESPEQGKYFDFPLTLKRVKGLRFEEME